VSADCALRFTKKTEEHYGNELRVGMESSPTQVAEGCVPLAIYYYRAYMLNKVQSYRTASGTYVIYSYKEKT